MLFCDVWWMLDGHGEALCGEEYWGWGSMGVNSAAHPRTVSKKSQITEPTKYIYIPQNILHYTYKTKIIIYIDRLLTLTI